MRMVGIVMSSDIKEINGEAVVVADIICAKALLPEKNCGETIFDCGNIVRFEGNEPQEQIMPTDQLSKEERIQLLALCNELENKKKRLEAQLACVNSYATSRSTKAAKIIETIDIVDLANQIERLETLLTVARAEIKKCTIDEMVK